LEGGKIIEVGDHKDLIKNKNYYYELFTRQEFEKEV
jgi:ABC-type multidrug transport system fused ATPase/permease subunit